MIWLNTTSVGLPALCDTKPHTNAVVLHSADSRTHSPADGLPGLPHRSHFGTPHIYTDRFRSARFIVPRFPRHLPLLIVSGTYSFSNPKSLRDSFEIGLGEAVSFAQILMKLALRLRTDDALLDVVVISNFLTQLTKSGQRIF